MKSKRRIIKLAGQREENTAPTTTEVQVGLNRTRVSSSKYRCHLLKISTYIYTNFS